jgi:hypothetical protein
MPEKPSAAETPEKRKEPSPRIVLTGVLMVLFLGSCLLLGTNLTRIRVWYHFRRASPAASDPAFYEEAEKQLTVAITVAFLKKNGFKKWDKSSSNVYVAKNVRFKDVCALLKLAPTQLSPAPGNPLDGDADYIAGVNGHYCVVRKLYTLPNGKRAPRHLGFKDDTIVEVRISMEKVRPSGKLSGPGTLQGKAKQEKKTE